MSRKVLVLHDYFEGSDGGGRLCSLLARELPATLGYGFARRRHPFLQEAESQINLHAGSRLPLWRQFKLARRFQRHNPKFSGYDTAVYSGFYAPLAVLAQPAPRNVLYCHTPPRFIYDQREFYLSRLPPALRPLLQRFIDYLQPRYEAAARRMDLIVTNSANVRSRIRRYLGLEAQVIHPPCETARYAWQAPQGYYLSTARLDPLKRVDLIVQAFLQMPDKRLVVASGGSELAQLKKLAANAPNIQFTGWIDETGWRQWLSGAIATLYLPTDEDFGMSPVESMAAGKPVIGVAEGGLLETVVPGKTGILILPERLQAETIADAVRRLTPEHAIAMRYACEQRAAGFGLERFIEEMRGVL